MEELWSRIESWLATNAPNALNNLQIGATDEQIRQVEREIGVELPDDVKEVYRLHNGQIVGTPGFLCCQVFLSLEEIVRVWSDWIEISEAYEEIAWNPSWIPIAHNDGGDYSCVDLDSASGEAGRIIWAGHEYIPEIEVVASSFRSWLEKFADELEAGIYEYYEGTSWKGLFTKEDLKWIRREEQQGRESYDKARRTEQIISRLFEALPLEEQQEYNSRGSLDLPHAEAVIDRLPSNKQQEYLEQGVLNLEESRFVLQQLYWRSVESLGLRLGSNSVLDD